MIKCGYTPKNIVIYKNRSESPSKELKFKTKKLLTLNLYERNSKIFSEMELIKQ